MQVKEVGGLSWLVRERVTGCEWRFETSDMAWDAGGYDLRRFEVHVIGERVVGAPDGYPDSMPSSDGAPGASPPSLACPG
ncbi:hypothetical protein GCM10027598_58920 [Amycolatopsis oliviviridis]|uniref:Uncharacterized protein n=1 Tax=Amycolatopsis oliviviridis TaxID=1471590 RepID=A0ABQ3LX82_9PSEU|nr:hypothetical protein GCM10017790_59570 [Amycolatopsis oliviviridis]